MTRGFSCVFWGMPAATLFCIQLLIGRAVISDPFIRISIGQLYFFLFFATLGIVCYGLLSLTQAEGVGPLWRRWGRIGLVSAALNLYFSPFLYWWQSFPDEARYTLNVFALILSAIVLLVSLNLMCVELGRFSGDRSLQGESKLFLILNAVILGVPAISAFAWAAIQSWQRGSGESLGLEFIDLFRLPSYWRMLLFVLLFLPISLTLANVWRVKEMLLDELKKFPGE